MFAFLVPFGAACDSGSTSKPCGNIETCPSGTVCVEGKCVVSCSADEPCTPPLRCDDGVCVERTGSCERADDCTRPGSCESLQVVQCRQGECIYSRANFGAACDDNDVCTVGDSCSADGHCSGLPKRCETPPAATCATATELEVPLVPGSCDGGTCTYSTRSVPCADGCVADACAGDPCAGVACSNAPSPRCLDSHLLRSYAAMGTCANGLCSYASTNQLCPFGCADGTCLPDPCRDVICDTPDRATCMDASTLLVYASPGACTDGSCRYGSVEVPCTSGCAQGVCSDDLCFGLTCTTPPAAVCASETTLTTRALVGVCSGGLCDYATWTIACPFGCSAGACQEDPCASRVCDSPPTDRCVGSRQLERYTSPGVCVAGDCTYGSRLTRCPYECKSGECVCVPNCAGRTCGDDGCGGRCANSACPNQPSLNTVLSIAGDWYLSDAANSMVSVDNSEAPGSGTFRGALFYLVADQDAGQSRVALHRLHNYGTASGTDRDHMVSTQVTNATVHEGAPDYALDLKLGYLYPTAIPGTLPVNRHLRNAPYDHSVGIHGPASGYVQGPQLGFAFPRGGLADEELRSLNGAEVRIDANRWGGGAIWGLGWGGKEFVNVYDFGRQIQIAFQLNNAGEEDNPTEAGDLLAKPSDPAGWRHGSPTTVLDISGKVLSTQARPLQWHPANFTGGRNATAHPVMWNGLIGKRVEVDFAGNAHVIRWTTQIEFPQAQGAINMEVLTAYLTADFDHLYMYNAATQSLQDLSATVPNGGCVDPAANVAQRPQAGGAIMATADGNYALGVYRDRPIAAHEGYGLCKFLSGGQVGARDFPTTKFNLLERPSGGLDAGQYEWVSYLVVGSLADTVAAMDWLYEGVY